MPDEQVVIENVRIMRKKGMTWEQITEFINGQGPAWWARTGRPWSRQNLAAATQGLTRVPYTRFGCVACGQFV